MTALDISRLLFDITQDEDVLDPNCELIDSGILDSLATIELFSALEDLGIEIYPTRIDRAMLSTPLNIAELVNNHTKQI